MSCRRYDGKRGVTYYYSVDIAPKGAPRQQVQRRGFRTKKACEAARHTELSERHTGTALEPSRETLAAYLDRWRATSAPRWRPATQYRLRHLCARIAGELGDVPLGHLDGLQIQAAYTRLLERLAPRTVHQTHTALKHALQQAVRWKLLRENPAEGVSLPAIPAAAVEAWSAAERARFLEATVDDECYPLWVFLLDSGCRIGEALALRWEDVDLETRYVTIRRTMTRSAAGETIVGATTKTASSQRSIQLSAETTALLVRGSTSPFVFDRGDGQPWKLGALDSRLRVDCRQAGVPVLSTHGLRKTMTTLWLEAGVNPAVVAARLGHTTVQMTLNVYTKVSRTWGEQGVEQVAAYLNRPGSQSSTSVG